MYASSFTQFAANQNSFRALPFRKRALLIAACIPVIVGAADLGGRAFHALTPDPAAASQPALFTGSVPNAATSTGGVIPARIFIPSIGVDATVEQVGLKRDGSVGTPSSFTATAWYTGSAEPGASGNAIIDGHVNNALTTAGVFEHLDQVRIGDTITLTDNAGKTLSYTVTGTELYGVEDAPLAQIFATDGPPQLLLITCNGAWDQGKKEFDKRLVVYAALRAQ